MKTRLPTTGEIQSLAAFLPRLYKDGFEPVQKWEGGTKYPDGIYRLPWPVYDPVVEEFFRMISQEYWTDFDYSPEEAYQMITNEEFINKANLPQIKTMLTFCLRGERFSDGHWAEMIEKGYIRQLLERLTHIT